MLFLFNVKLTERLPREAAKSPSLDIFKTHLSITLCKMLQQNSHWPRCLQRCCPVSSCGSAVCKQAVICQLSDKSARLSWWWVVLNHIVFSVPPTQFKNCWHSCWCLCMFHALEHLDLSPLSVKIFISPQQCPTNGLGYLENAFSLRFLQPVPTAPKFCMAF